MCISDECAYDGSCILNPNDGVEITDTPSESVLPFPAQTLIHLARLGDSLPNPQVKSTDFFPPSR